jgi:hypothetical protein
MVDILLFAETSVRVVLAVIFLVTPGIAFWLVVTGLAVLIRRLGSSKPFRAVRNSVGAVSSQPSVLS